ncbi:MAG TPA: SRPBCC domain-containing protein [Gaiellaceae bacterium]
MSTTESLAAITKTITVDVPPETAFETFTRQINTWWPKTHSVFEDRIEEIVFDERVGGRVYERSTSGEEADWADVVAWEPHNRFVLRWRVNPERGPTEVEVRFTPEGSGTRVDLEHRGWDDPEGRANYGPGWDRVLGQYVDAFRSE